jgi:hypothetical protein
MSDQPLPDKPERDDELATLTAGYCNGTLVGEEQTRLERLLLDSSSAREFFRRYLALDAALHSHGGSPAMQWLSMPPEPKPADSADDPMTLYLWRFGGAAALSALLGLAAYFFWPTYDVVIGNLEQISGDVRLFAASGEARALAADGPIHAGDTIRTRGSDSSGVVAYPDGTRVTLLGNTSVTYGDARAKSLVVHEGTLAASVSPQPAATPMMVATPLAQMEVLGTRFLVEALAGRTGLSVSQGRVRLVRIRDGEAVEVGDGEQTVVTEKSQLVVEDTPRRVATWEADFETGLPEGWSSGERVTEGLPSGSKGGVKSARHVHPDGSVDYLVGTHHEWLSGLFQPEADSHVHFTFKVKGKNWFSVLFATRTADPNAPQYSGNYIYDHPPSVEQDRWHEISIPLAAFKRIHRGKIPITDVIPFALTIGSDQPELEIVVDRIWVTPTGSGKVETRELP